MFLHEPGEENDSFTRQDLSMMNSIQTQNPNQPQSNAAPPPPPRIPLVAAAAPMNRQDSSDSSSPIGDAPGLPATASWGNKAVLERRASRSTNTSNPSPLTTNAVPDQPIKQSKSEEAPKKKGKDKEKPAQTSKPSTPQPPLELPSQPSPAPRPTRPLVPGLDGLLKAITSPDFKFVFHTDMFSEDDLRAIKEFPQLLDPNGGAKRRAMKEKEKEKELELQREAEAQSSSQSTARVAAPVEQEDNTETTAGGSLQLGGEPEERHESLGQGNRHAIAPPNQHSLGGLFGQNTSLGDDFGNVGPNNRGLTPQQQQQILLSSFKSSAPPSAGLLSNFQASQHQQNHIQPGTTSGHTRHASRFSFANDSASASASVQPVANQKLMNQQSSMMPKTTTHFNQVSQHQPLGQQFYTSSVQGPPPGLKATGTPPVSGGGMFGQGHGFATGGLGYGANAANRNNNEAAIYQDILQRRTMDGGARGGDAGKRESMFPSFLNQHPTTSTPAPAPGLLNFPYGPSPGAYQDSGSQKSKKKGKKHRHANTSSSGGGGVVDVQDPSILQARLHQGGNMTGQGLYAGQGQGGFSSSSIYNGNNYGGGVGRW